MAKARTIFRQGRAALRPRVEYLCSPDTGNLGQAILVQANQNTAGNSECGFLSNGEETALLNTQAHQNRLAVTVLASVLDHLRGTPLTWDTRFCRSEFFRWRTAAEESLSVDTSSRRVISVGTPRKQASSSSCRATSRLITAQ